MKTLACTLILLFTATKAVLAQDGSRYKLVNISTNEGLSQNSVNLILQDRQGMIWLGTQVGLDRFDGKKIGYVGGFQKSLTEKITILYDWDEDNIFVSTDRKNYFVNKWDRNKVKEILFPVLGIKKIIPTGKTFILITNKEIWTTSKDFKNSKKQIEFKYQINAVLQKGNDILYIGTEKGIVEYEPSANRLTRLPLDQDSAHDYPIVALCFNHDSSLIYIGLRSYTIHAFSIQQRTLVGGLRIKAKLEKNVNYWVTSLFRENDSCIWAGTQNEGLFVLNESDSSSQINVTTSSPEINSIYNAPDKVVWIGTGTNGVDIFQPEKQNFISYYDKAYFNRLRNRKKEGLDTFLFNNSNNRVWNILPINNRFLLLATSGNGIAVWDKKREGISRYITATDAKERAEKMYVHNLLEFGQNILVGTEQGLSFMASEKSEFYKPVRNHGLEILQDTPITVLNKDPDNKLIFAGSKRRGEIYVLDENFRHLTTIFLPDKSEKLSFIYNLFLKNQHFPIVGTTNGIYKMDTKNWRLTLLTDSVEKVHYICAYQKKDADSIWVGTDRLGLFCFRISKKFSLIEKHNKDNGLPVEVIYAIQQDRGNHYWFSTNHGIYEYLPGIGFNIYQNAVNNEIHEFNSGSYASIGDSLLYFGGLNGITVFKPRTELRSNSRSPFRPLVEYTFSTGEHRHLNFNSKDPAGSDLIDLPYYFGYLELTPLLGYFQDSKNIQFRVKLNNQPISPDENGKYLILERQLHWAQHIGSVNLNFGNTDYISISYRIASGDWVRLPNIRLDREWLAKSNHVYIYLVLVALALIYLTAKYIFNQRRLAIVLDKINIISRLEKKKDLSETAITHLIDSFKYDYAVISFVDYHARIIKTFDGDTKKKSKITNPKLWKHLSKYPLDHNDILAQTAREGREIIVINNIPEPNKNIVRTPDLFNQEITKQFRHERLSRIYIPIIYRATEEMHMNIFDPKEEKHQSDVVLGIIEVGFLASWFEIAWSLLYFPSIYRFSIFKRKFKNIRNYDPGRVRLKLYVDKFAQQYYKTYVNEQQNKLLNLVNHVERRDEFVSKFDPQSYLKATIDALSQNLKVPFAGISLTSYNTVKIDFNIQEKERILIGCSPEEAQACLSANENINSTRSGIVNHVLETKAPFITGDVNADKRYIKIFEKAKSEMAFPMVSSEESSVFGVISFLSEKDNYFNEVILVSLVPSVKKITETYIRKKQLKALQDIVQPFETFNHSERELYIKVVEVLKNYFNSDYISIWTRDFNNELSFRLHESTPEEFFAEYKTAGLTEGIKQNDYDGFESLEEMHHFTDDQMAKDNLVPQVWGREMRFKSYIILKVVIDKKFKSFIYIFSKRHIEKDEISGYAKVFLREIVKKISLATQSNTLFNSIEVISRSIVKRNSENAKEIIVKQAYSLLPSVDSVVLFTYTRGKEIRMKDAHVGGHIPLEDQANPEKTANFANFIINNDTLWIGSKEEYLGYLEKVLPDKPHRENFWTKKQLEAVAGIKLQYENEPIGVMFFNYKVKDVFKDENIKQFINAFTDFARIAIVNEEFVKRIELARDELKTENIRQVENLKNLQEEKRQLMKESESLTAKMKDLLPTATRKALFQIVQQVNHDIVSQLLTLKFDLLRIVESSATWIKKSSDRKSLEQNINSINNNIKRTGDLIKLFKPSAFKDTNEKLIDIIKYTVALFERKYKHDEFPPTEFDLSAVSDVPLINCVKAELSMIFYNLIANAEKAIFEKRRPMTDEASQAYQGKIKLTLGYDQKRDQYLFSINDNGIGIDKSDTYENIYRLGFTTRPEEENLGDDERVHGIGLYFIQNCIEKNYRGSIVCESYKGEETTFFLRFGEYYNEDFDL